MVPSGTEHTARHRAHSPADPPGACGPGAAPRGQGCRPALQDTEKPLRLTGCSCHSPEFIPALHLVCQAQSQDHKHAELDKDHPVQCLVLHRTPQQSPPVPGSIVQELLELWQPGSCDHSLFSAHLYPLGEEPLPEIQPNPALTQLRPFPASCHWSLESVPLLAFTKKLSQLTAKAVLYPADDVF